jgi:hypothetical protein
MPATQANPAAASSVETNRRKTLLSVSPSPVDFGVIPVGGKKEIEITIFNPGKQAVQIDKVETTCDCLKVDFAGQLVQPGKALRSRTVLDMASDPDFVGDLQIRVRALTEKSQPLLSFEATAKVEENRS